MPSGQPYNPLIQYWHTKRFQVLLISLALLLVSSPFLQAYNWFGIFRNVLMSWIFIEIFHSTARGHKRLLPGSLLVFFAIAALWAETILSPGADILAISSAFIVIFLFFSIVVLAKFIATAECIDQDIICAAVIVYLLISMVWGFFYATLEAFVPGSFAMPFETIQSDRLYWFLYFSYVTITTLGYGDITPLNAKACALASTEALIGQIYLVVVVAWLVGMHVSERSRR
jgi:hypothetical protein